MEQLVGFLAINKPVDVSSFHCIKKIKRLLPSKSRVGHSGTLDKEANGLLIIGISRQATKLTGKLLNLDKHYLVKAKLGELTSTLDYSGEILKTIDPSTINEDDLKRVIESFDKEYEQIPPIYSALKHEGKPLYKHARHKILSQEDLERIASLKRRVVNIYELELISTKLPYFTFHAHVSKGTYIRTLADDIAKKLDNHATVYDLSRTQIGDITLDDAISINDIKSLDDIKAHLINIDTPLKF